MKKIPWWELRVRAQNLLPAQPAVEESRPFSTQFQGAVCSGWVFSGRRFSGSGSTVQKLVT